MTWFRTILAAGALLILLSGCRKATDANWDVDVVLPVVNSELNIRNFAGDSIFSTDNQGLLSLSINREVAAIKLDSLLQLPDTTISPAFTNSLWQGVPLNPGQPIPGITGADMKFNLDYGISLKKADIRTGFIHVKFSNNADQPLDMIYELPGARKNGQPFTIKETIPTGHHSLVRTYDLSGYSLNLRGKTGNAYNTLVQTVTLAVSASGTSVVVQPAQGATVEVSYSDITPALVEGFFGQQTIDLPLDTTQLDLVENFQAANFMLSDATMDFRILNEFGAEFTCNLQNVKSINAKQANTVPLNSGQLGGINIDRASRVGAEVFPTVRPLLLNSTNSNIRAFVSNLPDQLSYQGKVTLNPYGNLSGFNDFAFYNTGLRILADINIPLRFKADYFLLTSNANIDLGNVKQLDNVNHGNFVVSAVNGFPFSARLQAYMLDANNVVIDSLFISGSNTVDRGQLNAQNEVVAPSRSRVLIPITQSKIESLKKCKTIKINSYFIMPPNPPDIKILEHYGIKVDIIAEVNYNVGLRTN